MGKGLAVAHRPSPGTSVRARVGRAGWPDLARTNPTVLNALLGAFTHSILRACDGPPET